MSWRFRASRRFRFLMGAVNLRSRHWRPRPIRNRRFSGAEERVKPIKKGRPIKSVCLSHLHLKPVKPASAVDQLFELFSRLEERDFLRRHVDEGAGLRVAPLAHPPLPETEAAEPADLNLVSLRQRLFDAVEDGVDQD